MVGPCRLRNIIVNVKEVTYTYIVYGKYCAAVISLGNAFFIASGLDEYYLLAETIGRLSSLDFGELIEGDDVQKVGKVDSCYFRTSPALRYKFWLIL